MLYQVLKPPIAFVVRAIWRPAVSGTSHIPRRGAAIIASNHQSLFETVILPCSLPRMVHFLAKSDIFRGGSLANTVLALFLRSVSVMPIDRSGGRAANSAIEGGVAVLRRGGVLGIYPEGTRSPDGRMYRGKTGAIRMALATGAPVIPVGMRGTFEAQQGRRIFPRRHPRMEVVVGEPFDAVARARELHRQGLGDGAMLRRLTDELMAKIRALSGQEYVDRYAADVKRALREHGTHRSDS